MCFHKKYIKVYKHCIVDFMLGSHVFRCVHKNYITQLVALPCCLSVCLYQSACLPMDGFSWNLILEDFLEICWENEFWLKSYKSNGYFTWYLYTFMTMSRWILLKMRNISDKSCRGNQKTYFVFSNFFFKNDSIYEVMWKNMVEPDRLQVTYHDAVRMQCTCWIIKTRIQAHTHDVKYLLLFHGSSGYTKVPPCCIICTLLCLITFIWIMLKG